MPPVPFPGPASYEDVGEDVEVANTDTVDVGIGADVGADVGEEEGLGAAGADDVDAPFCTPDTAHPKSSAPSLIITIII